MSEKFRASSIPFFSADDGDNWNEIPGFRVILSFPNTTDAEQES